jgi:hypothetical protein
MAGGMRVIDKEGFTSIQGVSTAQQLESERKREVVAKS